MKPFASVCRLAVFFLAAAALATASPPVDRSPDGDRSGADAAAPDPHPGAGDQEDVGKKKLDVYGVGKLIHVIDVVVARNQTIILVQLKNIGDVDVPAGAAAAVKTLQEAVTDLKGRVEKANPATDDFMALRLELDSAERQLRTQREHRPKEFNRILVEAFPGEKVPAHAIFSRPSPQYADMLELPSPSAVRLDSVTVEIPAEHLPPGRWSVILTPVDTTHVAGGAVFGDSVTVAIRVEN